MVILMDWKDEKMVECLVANSVGKKDNKKVLSKAERMGKLTDVTMVVDWDNERGDYMAAS
jgi:hypothetical protein